jgi:glycosyltransferase involved in cell wall biosynthesis
MITCAKFIFWSSLIAFNEFCIGEPNARTYSSVLRRNILQYTTCSSRPTKNIWMVMLERIHRHQQERQRYNSVRQEVGPAAHEKAHQDESAMRLMREGQHTKCGADEKQQEVITFRQRLDLLHTQYVCPLISRCATAVTIHEILFETHPQFFTPFFNFRSRVLIRWAARKSKRVFTVSAFARDELVRCYGVSPDKVILISNAADTDKFYAGDAGAEKLASLQLVRDEYFLSVGRLEPRKNYPRLIRAYAKLPADAPKLVIVGQKDFGFDEIFQVSQECRLGNRLQILENVSDEMLGPLYRNARAMVYPSLAEGFGMPILEAMASHVPVLTSHGTALSEIGGDAALLVDPTSENEIVSGLTRLLYDDDLLRELRAKSAARAREFRWEASAAGVASAYRTLFQPLPQL